MPQIVGDVLPLQWGRNLIVAEGVIVNLTKSSVLLLQWGRNLIVAEGPILTSTSASLDELQWGRNLIVAEGSHLGPTLNEPGASMGPQLDSCGRLIAAVAAD